MDMSRRITAEFFGTFWLVFGGCVSVVRVFETPGWLN
jgi:glycerol uptake facilitator-like aquaporin